MFKIYLYKLKIVLCKFIKKVHKIPNYYLSFIDDIIVYFVAKLYTILLVEVYTITGPTQCIMRYKVTNF